MNLKNTEIAFERFAKAVVKQAKANLTRGGHRVTGDLYKSLDDWTVKVSASGSLTLVFNMEDYGVFQDKGVKGKNPQKAHRLKEPTPYKFRNKMPPFRELRKWVQAKGIQHRDRQTGRFRSYDQTARTIQRSIYQKGIPQTLFFSRPFRNKFTDLPENILAAFGRDVDDFLDFALRD